MGRIDGFKVELREHVRDLLLGLKVDTGGEYFHVAGKGRFVIMICFKLPTAQLVALKWV